MHPRSVGNISDGIKTWIGGGVILLAKNLTHFRTIASSLMKRYWQMNRTISADIFVHGPLEGVAAVMFSVPSKVFICCTLFL